jgi:hypothetical protein
MFDDLEHHFYTDLRCGIVNTFVDPCDKLEQKKAYDRMWKNKFRNNNPERAKQYERNRKKKQTYTPTIGQCHKEWYIRNKKTMREKAKIKYKENHENELMRFKTYRNANREKGRHYALEYYYKNRVSILAKNKTDEIKTKKRVYAKKWCGTHPEKIKQYHSTPSMKKYYQERGKTEKYKQISLRHRRTEHHKKYAREKRAIWRKTHVVETLVQAHLSIALKRYASGKKYSSEKYGVDYNAIANKLGKRPSGCEADHIIPVSLFDLNDPEQIKCCFSPDNYQWLPKLENIQKGGRNKPKTVAKYLPILKQKLGGI